MASAADDGAADDAGARGGLDPRTRRRRVALTCVVVAVVGLGAAGAIAGLGFVGLLAVAGGPRTPALDGLSPAGWAALLADARALAGRPEARGSYVTPGARDPQTGAALAPGRPPSELPATLAGLGALEVSVGERAVSLTFPGGLGYGYTVVICADEAAPTPASEAFVLRKPLRPGVYLVAPHH